MRLPSIRTIAQEAGSSFRRFPVVIVDAALVTVAAILLVDREASVEASLLYNILLAGFLGIPLLFALALVSEKRGLGRPAAIGLQAFGVLALLGYGITVPTDLSHAPFVTLWRFFILAGALSLFATVAPFIGKGDENGFWNYNKALFLRLFTASLYSGVLFVGLAIALAALENLFAFDIPEKRYMELWILIGVLFNTWVFLSGIPDKLTSLESYADYPKGLKIFSQYILFPIVLVYLIILYAYMGKILLSWDWPQGYVSKLVLGFSATGMFFLLLLHPLKDRVESVWIAKAARSFYIVLIPLIVMLFLAVWRRVSEYGVTEGRYLALALGLWITFVTLYFMVSRTKSIKVIPESLCLLAFFVSFGPWGAFSVASRSQIGRLEKLVTQAGILTDGKVHQVRGNITFQQAKEISAILSYLRESHGLEGIQSWFDETLKDASITSGVAYKSPSEVAKMMGFEHVARWREAEGGRVTLEAGTPFEVGGYDRMVQVTLYVRNEGQTGSLGAELSYQVTREMDSIAFTSAADGQKLLEIDLRQHVDRLLKEYETSPTGRLSGEQLAVSAVGKGVRVRICPWQIQFQMRSGEQIATRIVGVILYSMEEAP